MTNNCLIHQIILNVKILFSNIQLLNGILSYKNKIIGIMYPQYREENGKNDNKVHYSEMWKNMAVY
jgi:hypothetical protein